MTFLQMSLSGSVLILLVILVRAAGLRFLPKRTFLLLWAIVLVRLLAPFPAAYSVPFPLPAAVAEVAVLPGPAAPRPVIREIQGTDPEAAPAESPAAIAGFAEETANMPMRPDSGPAVSVWRIIWLAGVCGVGAVFAALYLRGYRRFRAAVPVEHEAARAWLAAHPLRRHLSLRVLERVDSPRTYGIFRPVILVPVGTNWQAGELRYALEHEYVHVRRLDAAAKLFLALTLTAHWFNPAVWMLYVLANRDLELACDEAVLRRFGAQARSAYAMALLAMEERRSAFPALTAGFGANATKGRILAIMKYKKRSALCLVLAAVLVLSLAACAAGTAGRPFGAEGNGTNGSAAGSDLHGGQAGSMRLTVPDLYADLLLVEAPENAADGTLFTVTEKASAEAGAALHPGEDREDGWLFSIRRVSAAELHEMLCSDMSGVQVFAWDGDGTYYLFCTPTDVRFAREGEPTETDWAQWEALNEWAWTVRGTFLTENDGLTDYRRSNTDADILLSRLAYTDGVAYTISSVAFGPLEPGNVDKTPYLDRLLDNVVLLDAEDEVPGGEFVSLSIPGEDAVLDFFLADGNYIRMVRGDLEEHYRAVYADGTVNAAEVMNAWYLKLAADAGKIWVEVRFVDPADYGLTADLLQGTTDFQVLSTEALCAFFLNTDGAGAEGSGEELYRRFVADPDAVLAVLVQMDSRVHPITGETAAEVLCRQIAYADVFWHDGAEEYAAAMETCRARYPSGAEAGLLDRLQAEHDTAVKSVSGIA